ncbi:MAG: xylose isomerase, partial [Chitinophagaceae bacterium]
MNRRNFVRTGLLAGAAASATAKVFGKENNTMSQKDKPFNLNYAFHDGMFKNHGGGDFIDQIKFAYDKGFRSIEDNGMMGRPAEVQKKIGDTLAKLGMTMGVFVITSDNWHWKTSLASGKQEWIDKMVKDCKEAVEVAKRCNA